MEEASHHYRRFRDQAAGAPFLPFFRSPREGAVQLTRTAPHRTCLDSVSVGFAFVPILSRPDSDVSCVGGRRFHFIVKYLEDTGGTITRTPDSTQHKPREHDASLVTRAPSVESNTLSRPLGGGGAQPGANRKAHPHDRPVVTDSESMNMMLYNNVVVAVAAAVPRALPVGHRPDGTSEATTTTTGSCCCC